jgi:hypothetical protein
MAPLPEIDDTFRVAFIWNNLNVVNVMHFHGTTVTPVELFGQIQSHVTSNMWAVVNTQNGVSRLAITPLFGNASTTTYATDGTSKWKGVQASGDPIPNTAAVVSKHTVFRGRSNRGRSYIGPVSENAIVNGIFASTIPGDMVTAWTNFQTGLIAEGIEEVVASYKDSTAITVINYSVRNAAGTVRRRQSRLAQ